MQHTLTASLLVCLSEKGFSLDELVWRLRELFERQAHAEILRTILLLVEEKDELHAASNQRALAEVTCPKELRLIPVIGVDYAISRGFEQHVREATVWFKQYFAAAATPP